MVGMDKSPLILAIDFGTQSVRVSLIDKKGDCLDFEKETYEPAYYSPKPGFAEMDPSIYFDYLCKATHRLVEKCAEEMSRVKGIVLDCFRDSAVMLDKDRNVVRPAVLWLDSRMAKCEKKLPLIRRAIFKIVGMDYVVKMNRRRTVMNWMIENEPESVAKCDKYVSVSTYFIYRLTGQLQDSAGSYTGHYPMDYKKGKWDKNPATHLTGSVFSIRKDQLCRIVEPNESLGKITKEASELTGLPEGMEILLSGSDKSCETLGDGVIDSTMASISLGTACSVETTTKKYISPIPFLPCYRSVVEGDFNMDIQVYRGFWMMNWFLKEFAAEKVDDFFKDPEPQDYDSMLESIPPGSGGLLLQPYWGSLLDRPQVRGAIIGFNDSTTRAHIYRSLLEGIGFELYASLNGIRKRLGKLDKIQSLRVSGGGAKSDEICQMFADIFGLPVTRVQSVETSSLGASIAGFLRLGEFASTEEAVKAMVHPQKTFEPNMENHAIYEDLFKNGYSKLYPQLKGVYAYLYNWSQK